MQRARELFINGVRQVRVHGNVFIPTVVRYEGGKALVGVEALQGCEDPSQLREDFKVEIGNEDPLKLAQRTGAGSYRGGTIHPRIAERLHRPDYQHSARPNRPGWVGETDEDTCGGALGPRWRIRGERPLAARTTVIACAASSPASSLRSISCRSHSRSFNTTATACVTRSLPKRIRTSRSLSISGVAPSIPASSRRRKQATSARRAGTRSPWPQAPSSIGGYAINRLIAEELLLRIVEKGYDRTLLKAALKEYQRLKNLDDPALAMERHAVFARNYHRLLQSVEQAKCVSLQRDDELATGRRPDAFGAAAQSKFRRAQWRTVPLSPPNA